MIKYLYTLLAICLLSYNASGNDTIISMYQNAKEKYIKENSLPATFPALNISYKNKPANGHYFISSRYLGPQSPNKSNYDIIADTCGTPVYFRALENRGSDLRLQPNGYITHFPGETGWFVQLDSSFNEMRAYKAANGHLTDMHELLINSDSSYVLLTQQLHVIDMSSIVPGGSTQATVVEGIIQHISYNGNLLFQWNSLDHIPVTDADTRFVDLTGNHIDYIHINAIDYDDDGNFLISSRHTNEITKINSTTGQIIWRLGGINNQFTFINDNMHFYGQHSIRAHGNGIYTLFDNGNFHNPPVSRGLKYHIDENNMTATLENVYYTGDSTSYTNAMGHMQFINDKYALVGWAANTQGFVLTEYDENGVKTLDMYNYDTVCISYRAFKYKWKNNSFWFANDTITLSGEVYNYGDTLERVTNIYNNTDESIEISGYHTNYPGFIVVDNFPLELPANTTSQIHVGIDTHHEIRYSDVLTLYSNTRSDSMRIASQTRLFNNVIVNIQDNQCQENIRIFPNPVTEKINIESPTQSIIKAVLYNINGNIVLELPNIVTTKISIDCNNLNNGVYFLKIKTKTKTTISKIIKI